MSSIPNQERLYNRYSTLKMEVIECPRDWYELYIDTVLITEGDYEHVYDRIHLINKENGYIHLEE